MITRQLSFSASTMQISSLFSLTNLRSKQWKCFQTNKVIPNPETRCQNTIQARTPLGRIAQTPFTEKRTSLISTERDTRTILQSSRYTALHSQWTAAVRQLQELGWARRSWCITWGHSVFCNLAFFGSCAGPENLYPGIIRGWLGRLSLDLLLWHGGIYLWRMLLGGTRRFRGIVRS